MRVTVRACARQRQRGQVLVLFCLVLPFLLGTVGLAVDVGFGLAQRQRMQATADLAALNAAYCQIHPSLPMCVSAASFPGAGGSPAKGVALALATAHGYDPSAVTFVTPYAGDANRFQVRVAQPVPTRLLSLLNFKAFDISGRAVSAVQSGVVSQALLALDPTKCGAVSLTGSASIIIHNGGMQVNSNCATALTATGAASVDVQSSSLHVVGNYSTSGSASLTPTPVTGVAVVADPLASLAAPAGGTLQASVNCAGSTTMTIPPGIYPSITAGASCTLTMQPGIYILTGGGLNVSGNAKVTGNGVFIYNAGSNFPSSGGAFGPISLTGSGVLSLSPPTTGPYAGLLLFQSRDNPKPLTVSGAAALTGVQGTIYGVQMEVDISGSGTMPAQLIAASVTITGGADLTVEYTPSQVYGTPSTALVE